ncbi:uncharacterized protein LOC144624923 [Crassostrea virginica]
MHLYWRSLAYISCAFISHCNSNDGNCGHRSQINNPACCVDYYKDPRTKACLPCLGSFGYNCSHPCPGGFYGFGCRWSCKCNDTEECDIRNGCISKVDREIDKDHVKTKYISPIIGCFCIITIFSGIAFYCVKRRRKLQSTIGHLNHKPSKFEPAEIKVEYNSLNTQVSPSVGLAEDSLRLPPTKPSRLSHAEFRTS